MLLVNSKIDENINLTIILKIISFDVMRDYANIKNVWTELRKLQK